MKTLEKRFKIVVLAILADERFKCLDDKIEIVANAIDDKFPQAEEMVSFLENYVLKLAETTDLCLLN